MTALAPLKLTLYDLETYEPHGEYICNLVPLKYLELAVQLAKSLININADALNGLIVDLFGWQFSVDELVRHSEQSDRIDVLQALLLRAGRFTAKKTEEGQMPGQTPSAPTDPEDDWIGDLKISLIKAFGWSLHDIDEVYIETLLPFVERFIGSGDRAPAQKRVYADQVNWL